MRVHSPQLQPITPEAADPARHSYRSAPLEAALSALASARAVFDATRLRQRDTYEHCQLSGGSPAKSAR